MVPAKDTKYHFWEVEVEVGETHSIQVTVHGVIYNLLGMKDHNYVMRVMGTGGRLFEDEK